MRKNLMKIIVLKNTVTEKNSPYGLSIRFKMSQESVNLYQK